MSSNINEKLLIKILEWETDRINTEWPYIQAITRYKYDEYQQFSPGLNFIKNLANWLYQFKTKDEKEIGYNFIKKNLLFISSREMLHLVMITYSDIIKPILLNRVSEKIKTPSYNTSKIVGSKDFKIMRRKSLFLGLSDGARIDYFRRFSKELTHEQIWPIYDISPEKALNMKKELKEDLEKITKKKVIDEDCKFKNIFLLDDFSGSGNSYIREDKEKKMIKGKIKKFYDQILKPNDKMKKIIDENPYVCIVLYVSTENAIRNITDRFPLLIDNNLRFSVEAVQLINEEHKIKLDDPIIHLIENYYDPCVEDIHTKTGNTLDMKLGYESCALPLILHHNTPNNSISLLWSYYKCEFKGLFPRVKRHGVI